MLKTENQKQYREDLTEWCNEIYFYWESIKPRYSKLLDLRSLEVWEESCRDLIEKLRTELKVNFDDYQTAKSLHEQLELLHKESQGNQEKDGESNAKLIASLPSDSNREIGILSQETNDITKELDKEWNELIQMIMGSEIPIQEIRNFVSDYKR